MKLERNTLVRIFVFALIACVLFFTVVVRITYREFVVYIPSTGIIAFTHPYLSIQVSPPGYPKVGDFWTISVYIINPPSPSEKPAYQPAFNATVSMTVNTDSGQRTYKQTTDEKGKASFQYLAGYSDIAFQAYYENITDSPVIILTENYVSPDVVDTLLRDNVFTIIGSIASNFFFNPKQRKRWTLFVRLLLILVICLLLVVTLSSLYSKLFQGTVWGYPEKIFDGFVTFTMIIYLFYGTIVVLASYWVIKLIVYAFQNDEVWKSKRVLSHSEFIS